MLTLVHTKAFLSVLNETGINFKDKNDFLIGFSRFLENNISKIEQEIQDFELESTNSRWVDKNAVFLQHEEFGIMLSKQDKLLKKIISLKE